VLQRSDIRWNSILQQHLNEAVKALFDRDSDWPMSAVILFRLIVRVVFELLLEGKQLSRTTQRAQFLEIGGKGRPGVLTPRLWRLTLLRRFSNLSVRRPLQTFVE